MIDSEQSAKLEQSIAAISELVPRTAHALYRGFIEAGFTEQQAFEMVKIYVARVWGQKI